jgi:hypothetical protein
VLFLKTEEPNCPLTSTGLSLQPVVIRDGSRYHAGPFPFGKLQRDSTANAAKWLAVRKLIAFDGDTFDKLKQLARDRMATIQELADEAFADVLKKHGIPIDLKDAQALQPIFFRPFLKRGPLMA